ncbi:MAG: hypothetical protein ACFB13_04040 [Kiloniellaceae bacterium]
MATTAAFTLPKGAAPKIKALFDYWQSIHPAARPGGSGDEASLPGRQHLDPIDIPELLPNIWMIDVTHEAPVYDAAGANAPGTNAPGTNALADNVLGGIGPSRDTLRFRFRLVGTEIVKFTGRDATGCWLDEIYPDYLNTEAFRAHCAVAESGQPGYRKSGVLSNPGRNFVEAERLYLPLAEDGRHVDIVLVMTVYKGDPPRR